MWYLVFMLSCKNISRKEKKGQVFMSYWNKELKKGSVVPKLHI
jgi:hypothetical protein